MGAQEEQPDACDRRTRVLVHFASAYLLGLLSRLVATTRRGPDADRNESDVAAAHGALMAMLPDLESHPGTAAACVYIREGLDAAKALPLDDREQGAAVGPLSN